MSAIQRKIYEHMQKRGVILTDGSEKDKKVIKVRLFAGSPLYCFHLTIPLDGFMLWKDIYIYIIQVHTQLLYYNT